MKRIIAFNYFNSLIINEHVYCSIAKISVISYLMKTKIFGGHKLSEDFIALKADACQSNARDCIIRFLVSQALKYQYCRHH